MAHCRGVGRLEEGSSVLLVLLELRVEEGSSVVVELRALQSRTRRSVHTMPMPRSVHSIQVLRTHLWTELVLNLFFKRHNLPSTAMMRSVINKLRAIHKISLRQKVHTEMGAKAVQMEVCGTATTLTSSRVAKTGSSREDSLTNSSVTSRLLHLVTQVRRSCSHGI